MIGFKIEANDDAGIVENIGPAKGVIGQLAAGAPDRDRGTREANNTHNGRIRFP